MLTLIFAFLTALLVVQHHVRSGARLPTAGFFTAIAAIAASVGKSVV